MRAFIVSLSAVLLAVGSSPGQEAPVKSRIVSVGLFKNGLAVVKREVQVGGAGTFRLEAVPEVVHGTFWVESNVPVEAAMKLRDVETPAGEQPDGPLHEYFAGKRVTLRFTNEKLDPVQGVVPALPSRRPSVEVDPWGRGVAAERFFILKTAKGHLYVNPGQIAAIETEEMDKSTRRKPALLINVAKNVAKADQKPVVYVSYLSHGLAWAPSYRVDISDPKALAVEMATVLRNEMEDIEDAEVSLISGFPSVEFARVSSPLEANTTWRRFFQELSSRDQGRDQDVLSQQIVSNTMQVSIAPRLDLGAIPAGEGVDLHFEPVGKRSLGVGEAVSFTINKAKAGYERIVEWTVGTSGGEWSRRDPTNDELWDVVRFKNPFKFPLTTAPALVIEDGRFNGQRTCYWTNVGEETNLRITKSLSLRTASTEEEDKARPSESVTVGGHSYTRIHVKGELRVNNHRDQPVKLHILYSIRGQVAEADNEPRLTPREGSLTDVNPIRDVRWVVELQPGGEQRISYRYNTLAR
jgi:hypothetical protein